MQSLFAFSCGRLYEFKPWSHNLETVVARIDQSGQSHAGPHIVQCTAAHDGYGDASVERERFQHPARISRQLRARRSVDNRGQCSVEIQKQSDGSRMPEPEIYLLDVLPQPPAGQADASWHASVCPTRKGWLFENSKHSSAGPTCPARR